MNSLFKLIIMSAAILATSCNTDKQNNIIGKQNPKIENGILTPEVLWSFGGVRCEFIS